MLEEILNYFINLRKKYKKGQDRKPQTEKLKTKKEKHNTNKKKCKIRKEKNPEPFTICQNRSRYFPNHAIWAGPLQRSV